MAPKFTDQSIIAVPVTDARGIYALAQEGVDVADGEAEKLAKEDKALPAFIRWPLERLRQSKALLAEGLNPSVVDGPTPKEADSAIDDAWNVLYNLLLAWMNLDPALVPQASGAKAAFEMVFGDGRGFLNLNYRSEWVESDRRLAMLKESPYIDTLHAIGGAPVLVTLEEAHLVYGRALGITAQPVDEGAAGIGALANDVRAALRNYICKCIAWSEPEVEGSAALSETLLAPIESWKGTVATKSQTISTSTTAVEAPADETPPTGV